MTSKRRELSDFIIMASAGFFICRGENVAATTRLERKGQILLINQRPYKEDEPRELRACFQPELQLPDHKIIGATGAHTTFALVHYDGLNLKLDESGLPASGFSRFDSATKRSIQHQIVIQGRYNTIGYSKLKDDDSVEHQSPQRVPLAITRPDPERKGLYITQSRAEPAPQPQAASSQADPETALRALRFTYT